MRKRLTKTGNSVALVLDKALLKESGLDPNGEVEVSTNGEVIVISKVVDRRRAERLRKVKDDAHRRYAGVFKRLAE